MTKPEHLAMSPGRHTEPSVPHPVPSSHRESPGEWRIGPTAQLCSLTGSNYLWNAKLFPLAGGFLPTLSSCSWTTKHFSPSVQPIRREEWQQSQPTAAWHWAWPMVGVWQINGLTHLRVSAGGNGGCHRLSLAAWPFRPLWPDSQPEYLLISFHLPCPLAVSHHTESWPPLQVLQQIRINRELCASAPPYPLCHSIIQKWFMEG